MSHSPALVTGLTVDGVDLTRTDLSILFRIVSGGPESVWETRGDDTTVPTAPGQVPRSRQRHRLVIIAEGVVMGVGADEAAQRVDFANSRQAIRDLMDPTQAPYTLVHTDEAGSTWTITARPVNVVWSANDRIGTYREGSLEWLAVGADWEAGGS